MSFIRRWKPTTKTVRVSKADEVQFPGPKGAAARTAMRAASVVAGGLGMMFGSALLGGLASAFFSTTLSAGAAIAAALAPCSCDDALLLTFGCSCKEQGAVLRATRPPVDASKSEIPITVEVT